MRVTILAAAALSLGVGAAAGPAVADDALAGVLRTLDACAARLDRELDVGYERIIARCPDLPRSLAASGADVWLPPSWHDARNDLSAGSLKELRTALARERAAAPDGHRPEVGHLQAVLAALGTPGQERRGFWHRIAEWLRAIAAERARPQEPGFFARMVSRIGLPQTLIEIAVYVAVALMIGLAAWIISHELRTAGVLRRRTRAAAAHGLAPSAEGAALHAERDLELAALSEQPRLLLTLILERLSRVQGLLRPRSLTTRELTSSVRLPDDSDRRRLERLASVAEQVRYAAQPVSAVQITQALTAGRTLLEGIGAPEHRGPESGR